MFGFVKRMFAKKSYRLLYKRRCPPFTFELREYPPIERSVCVGSSVTGRKYWHTTWYPYTQFLIINPLGIPYFPPKVLHMAQTCKPVTSWNDLVYKPGVGNLYDLWRICLGNPGNSSLMTYDAMVKYYWNSAGGGPDSYSTREAALSAFDFSDHQEYKSYKSSRTLGQWVLLATGVPSTFAWRKKFPIPKNYSDLTLNDTESIMENRRRQKALLEAKEWAENIAAQERRVALKKAREEAKSVIKKQKKKKKRVNSLPKEKYIDWNKVEDGG